MQSMYNCTLLCVACVSRHALTYSTNIFVRWLSYGLKFEWFRIDTNFQFQVKQIIGTTTTTLVEKSGNKGKNWLYLEQDIITPTIKTSSRSALLQSDDYIHIVIEAVRGTGYPGDLAIDDITVTDTLCSKQYKYIIASMLSKRTMYRRQRY